MRLPGSKFVSSYGIVVILIIKNLDFSCSGRDCSQGSLIRDVQEQSATKSKVPRVLLVRPTFPGLPEPQV